MTGRKTSVPLGSLLLDYSIYPRSQVSREHVSHIADAIETGAEIPAPRVDQKTKRVVDGFHRIRAYQRILDPADKIPVELIEYDDEQTLIRDAIRLNANHGRAFSDFDRARSLSLAEEHGISAETVAADLGVPIAKVETLRDTRRAYGPDKQPLVLKSSVAQYMRGKTLTVTQVEANMKLDGMRPLYHVNQLITLIENDMVEWNEAFIERATRLAGLIGENA